MRVVEAEWTLREITVRGIGVLKGHLSCTDPDCRAPCALSVQVNAQVLPHNECVERNKVSADGQHVRHVTSCQNEVEKLQVSYVGNVEGTSIPLPRFTVPGESGKTDRLGRKISLADLNGERDRILHITGGSIRYFSFDIDPSLVGYSLRIRIQTGAGKAQVLAYLRNAALPQTSVFDMHPDVAMQHGLLDWHVRFPSAGNWYLGVFSSTSLEFTLQVEVEGCPCSCSDRGTCQLVNQGGGLVVGTCSCAYGYTGVACDKSARHVSSVAYYGSLLAAVLAPAAALLPAMYSLYLDRYPEAVIFTAASATALASLFSEIFGQGADSAAAAADAALTLAMTLVPCSSPFLSPSLSLARSLPPLSPPAHSLCLSLYPPCVPLPLLIFSPPL